MNLVVRSVHVLGFLVGAVLSAGTAAAQSGTRPGVVEIAPVVVTDNARVGTDVTTALAGCGLPAYVVLWPKTTDARRRGQNEEHAK